jgi:hypothetical protein
VQEGAVIASPTTQQILDACSRELLEVVLPAVEDETVKVTVMMLDLVLRNAALRAAHEIAWMSEEIAALDEFAGRSPSPAAASLHLADVVAAYRAASDAFSRAMEVAVANGDGERIRRAAELMERRVTHEEEIMAGWSPVGR